MSERTDWNTLRDRRLAEPGADEAYDAVLERLAAALEVGLSVKFEPRTEAA
jgi:hypothetical protein